MGRHIDRSIVTAFAVGAAWLLSFRLTQSAALSACVSILIAALLRRFFKGRGAGRRLTIAQAESVLYRIATLSEEDARLKLAALTGEPSAILWLRHPKDRVTRGELFALWRAHLGEEEIKLCVTCGVEALSPAPESPRMRVWDADALIALIRKSDMKPDGKRRPRGSLSERIARFSPIKGALYGLLLLPNYLLTGSGLSLTAGLGLLVLSGISLRAQKRQRP